MLGRHVAVLSVAVLATAISGSAGATYSLADYQSAVDAVVAVDPLIDPAPNDNGKDFAVGGFRGTDNVNNVGFSARSGPLGADPQGKLSETLPQFYGTSPSTYQGRFVVTCLTVVGNDAAVGLHPTDAASNDQTDEFVFAVHDSGLAGGTGDKYVFIPDVPAQDCQSFVVYGLAFGFTFDHGNILVHDAFPSFGVTDAWHGFFQPVDNNPDQSGALGTGVTVLNIAKAGSAIPVKFDLSGDQGPAIMFDSTYPSVKQFTCPSSGSLVLDSIEETSAGTSSGLQYDGTKNFPYGQYSYIWKTSSIWTGTCQRLTFKLADGTSHYAYFKFTK
jgi:hypothetical protein